jgi:hypothetical protein
MAGKKKLYKIGEKIGSCTYLRDSDKLSKERYCVFLCQCGNEFETAVKSLQNGHTKSCGCLRKKALINKNTKHGLSDMYEYSLWLNMKQRCTNPNFKYFKDWGGRGITLCEEWFSFEKFYVDMGKQPNKRMGIDRIDNNKGYSKENCRWATQKTQNNNKRNNLYIEYKGIIKSLSLWSDELNLNYEMARYYIHQKKKSLDEIFEITKKAA